MYVPNVMSMSINIQHQHLKLLWVITECWFWRRQSLSRLRESVHNNSVLIPSSNWSMPMVITWPEYWPLIDRNSLIFPAATLWPGQTGPTADSSSSCSFYLDSQEKDRLTDSSQISLRSSVPVGFWRPSAPFLIGEMQETDTHWASFEHLKVQMHKLRRFSSNNTTKGCT